MLRTNVLDDTPPKVAASVAVCAVETNATAAVNAPVVAPAATARLAGTVTLALLLDSATLAPPVGAAALSVTVHADEPGATRLPGLQLRLLTISDPGGWKPRTEKILRTKV